MAGPPLGKRPQDVAVGYDEHIPRNRLAILLLLVQDWSVPLLPDLLDQPVEALHDVGWAPVKAKLQVSTLSKLLKRPRSDRNLGIRQYQQINIHVLSPRTSVPPNVPVRVQPLARAQLADLGRRDALVLAVVPLADVLGDLNLRGAGQAVAFARGGDYAVRSPGQPVVEGEVQQFQRPLGAAAGGDVAFLL
jgi:hypothetical protein